MGQDLRDAQRLVVRRQYIIVLTRIIYVRSSCLDLRSLCNP